MVTHRLPTHAPRHVGMNLYSLPYGSLRDNTTMYDDARNRPLSVAHLHPAAVPGEEAFVPYLAATLRVETLQRQIARGETGGISQQVSEVGGVKVLTARTSASSMDTLKEAGDHLRDQLKSGVVVLGAVIDGEPKLLAMVTPDIIERGISARDIIKEIAPAIGGKGGGRPNMAQAGGKEPGGLDKALEMVAGSVDRKLGT